MKKLLCLGGNYFQMTAVKAAKRLGVYVIDVDYLPNNPAHEYADEYHNISTLDREGVLRVAENKGIDGILSYASDVSAPTAAYVAERLGLPTNPLGTVEIMTDKSRFHPFLKEHGFYSPEIRCVHSMEEAEEFYESVEKRIVIKPRHGSGSKGVTIVNGKEQLLQAINCAKSYAGTENVIVEEFVPRDGNQIAGDAFVVDGKIVYFGLADEHFDSLGYAPVPTGESFPAGLSDKKRQMAYHEIQRALESLNYKNGAVNLDFQFTPSGEIFILELGPRNGGNLISDAICLIDNVDLAEWSVKIALGEKIDRPKSDGSDMAIFVSTYIWHTQKKGIYEGIQFSDELKRHIVRSEMFVKQGDTVQRYDNGSCGLGAAILRFDTREQMNEVIDNMNEFCEVMVR